VFTDIPYLWYNVIGCVVLVLLALVIESVKPRKGAAVQA
jgi:hypothetical protein